MTGMFYVKIRSQEESETCLKYRADPVFAQYPRRIDSVTPSKTLTSVDTQTFVQIGGAFAYILP